MTALHNFFLEGAAGRIECLHKGLPEGRDATAAALVCHPHPLFGGTMHNKVVHAAATAILAAGIPVLRFNFRGAGLSAGRHDGGRGEQEDMVVVLDHLAALYPGLPLLLAGYSFGAYVGMRIGCLDDRIKAMIGIGMPVALYDFGFLRASRKPIAIVQGTRDQFGPLPLLMALAAPIPGGTRILAVKNATHGFTGQLDELSARLTEAIPDEM
jgi:alpha/beta superfamily hydrolase